MHSPFQTPRQSQTSRRPGRLRNRFPALALSGLCLLSVTISHAQGAGKKAPAPPVSNSLLPPLGPAQPVRLPAIVQKTLPNGLKLVMMEDHSQPAIWIRLVLPAGTTRDPKDRAGLTNLVADQLTKGTATRTETQISDTVDGLGATLSASADNDFLFIAAQGLSTQTDTLFDLLTDITLHPTFPQTELDRSRTQLLSAIPSSLSDGGALANAAMARLVYGGHPYGELTSGTLTSVPKITQADLVQFHKTYFAPNVATLFIAGDMTVEQATKRAETAFGSWEKKDLPALPAPPAPLPTGATPQITLIDRPGAAQTEIRIGVLTPGYNDPRRSAALVASAVLGQGQFEGRLTKEIRVTRGLSYGAESYFARYAQAGMFQISTYTKNASTGEVVKIALDEARKMKTEIVPGQELQDRKNYLIGEYSIGMATTTGAFERIIYAILYGKDPDYVSKFPNRVDAVTPTEIEDVMNNVDLVSPQIVLVGDAKDIESQVQALGKVTKIEAADVDLDSPTLQGPKAAVAPKTVPGAGSATPEELAEGKARMDAAIKAHGGDAFLNLKSLMLKGKGSINPPQLGQELPLESATLTAVMPGKARLDLKSALFTVAFGTPGEGMGIWLNLMGRVQDVSKGPSGSFDPTDLLRRAAQNKFPARPLPDLENGKLHGLLVTDDKGGATTIYLDAQTNLISRIQTSLLGADSVISLTDYHPTNGIPLPGKLVITQGGKPFLNLTFDTFEVNKPIDKTLFDRPKE